MHLCIHLDVLIFFRSMVELSQKDYGSGVKTFNVTHHTIWECNLTFMHAPLNAFTSICLVHPDSKIVWVSVQPLILEM